MQKTASMVILLVLLLLPAGPAHPQGKTAEVVVSGKVFCYLKQPVPVAYNGRVTHLAVQPGQPVKKGEALARILLDKEVALQLRQKVAAFHIDNIELQLSQLNTKMAQLQTKRNEVRALAKEKMAPGQSLKQIDREMHLLGQQRKFTKDRLAREKKLNQENLNFMAEKMGGGVKPGEVPEEVFLESPIDGHVVFIHPSFREEVKVARGLAAIIVGVMDPMILRTQVYEMEAVELKRGDKADFIVESIPGRKFEAVVNRVSWTTSTPNLDQPSYYEVEFKVANPDTVLREGLKGKIVFQRTK